MKIIEDSIDGRPPHGLSKKDISIVWPLLPSEWKSSIKIIRLCNQLNTPETAEYSIVSSRLNIFGRGKSRQVLIHEVLMELSSRLSMGRPVLRAKLSKNQKKNLSDSVSPLAARLVEAIRLEEG